jgi:uncharacterized protein (TIGR02599 family)
MNLNLKFGGKMAERSRVYAKRLGGRQSQKGFTLVELITAMTVLILILGIIAAATNSARSTMQRSQVEIGAFAVARSAFEDMSAKLSQATLNTYWDYYDSTGKSRGSYAAAGAGNVATSFIPNTYGRTSDLHFWIKQNTQQPYCGQEVYFQTPVAYSPTSNYQDTQGLQNAGSFYVEYCPDTYRPTSSPALIPAGTPNKWRYRLMQGLEPTENFSVYSNMATVLTTQAAPTTTAWTWNQYIKNGGTTITVNNSVTPSQSNVVPIADNVIALVVWPREPLRMDSLGYNLAVTPTAASATYPYDSQADMNQLPTSAKAQNLYDEQLPPILQLTVVVIDEASAARIATNTSTEPSQIKTAFANAKAISGATLFTLEANYNNDLTNLTAQLALAHINYRVMTTYVVMRESKWSQ